jgi:hypothetical protein
MNPAQDLMEVCMKEIVKVIAFILLIIGTVGLLVNEFVLDWGRAVTVILACLNVVGLIMLPSAMRGRK